MKTLKVVILVLLMALTVNANATNTSSSKAGRTSSQPTYSVGISHNVNSKREKEQNTSVSDSGILSAAEDALGDSSRSIPHCGGGRLACAAMVTRVLNSAGVSGINSDCTSDMYSQLCHSNHFKRVPVSSAAAGDIIISPSEGRQYGHVGIVGKGGIVYSNNSYSGKFDNNFTVSMWESYFGSHKDLGVYVYRKI